MRRVRLQRWSITETAQAAGISQRSPPADAAPASETRFACPAGPTLGGRRCPHRTGADTVAPIEHLRRQRMTGPQIAGLGTRRLAILCRLGLGMLSAQAQRSSATSVPILAS